MVYSHRKIDSSGIEEIMDDGGGSTGRYSELGEGRFGLLNVDQDSK